jgi:hypothetical protein
MLFHKRYATLYVNAGIDENISSIVLFSMQISVEDLYEEECPIRRKPF